MDIHGQVTFDAAAQRAMEALTEQDQLAHFMPHGSVITKTDARTFTFAVTKDIGITTVNLAGTMEVTPVPAANTLRFLVEGRHLIGGSAVLDLAIRCDGDAGHCVLGFTGTLQASGLIGKFLSLGEAKVQTRLETAFADFGRRLERHQKASRTRQAQGDR